MYSRSLIKTIVIVSLISALCVVAAHAASLTGNTAEEVLPTVSEEPTHYPGEPTSFCLITLKEDNDVQIETGKQYQIVIDYLAVGSACYTLTNKIEQYNAWLTFTSSNSDVLDVTPNGLVTAKKNGSASIKVMYSDNDKPYSHEDTKIVYFDVREADDNLPSATAPVMTPNPTNINEPTYVPTPDDGVYSIKIRKKRYKMGIKDKVSIIISEIKDNDIVINDSEKIAEIIDEGDIVFKSRNMKIVTVSPKGVIKAKAEGKAQIIVSYAEGILNASRHYIEVKVLGNKFERSKYIIKRGSEKTLRAQLGTEKKIKFSIRGKHIAEIVRKSSKSAIVRGINKGKAVVIAKAKGKTARCKVIVK